MPTLVPPRREVLLTIPALFRLRMTANNSNSLVVAGHYVAVLIARHRLDLGVHDGAPVVEEHIFFRAIPSHLGGGRVGLSYGGVWSLDVLNAVTAIQYVEVVPSSPVGSHADAEVPATPI